MRRVLLPAMVLVLLIGAFAPSAVASTRPAPSLKAPEPCPGCWHPALNTSWQWQLQWKVDTSVDVQMYDVDAFDNTKALVDSLHSDGRKVVCYISAGTWENWRPDAGDFPQSVLGAKNGWPGERWLDIRKVSVLRPIMRARIRMCAQKGFDGIEFDNVDAHSNRSGFPLSAADQLRYNILLANMGHKFGLSTALKNDVEQVKRLLPYFDFTPNEQCFQYHECGTLQPFLDAGKPVFNVEYKLDIPQFCPQANAMNFNSLKKKLSLGAWRIACR
ncbi:MAG: endo alpha-1,4 polygalactosaminidase [Actinomycetota bacterium]|nr:endo alpha-1,4 polygalactosaminidase [Actinomycetota bacterium]